MFIFFRISLGDGSDSYMVNVKHHKTASDSLAPGIINKFTQLLMSLYHDVIGLRLKRAQAEATDERLNRKR